MSDKALDEGRLQPVDKEAVVVTQADRDAADEQIGALLQGDGRERLLAGKMDSLSLVQAFARHRHQSETGAALTSVNEKSVMVCPQCEGEGGYPDGLDEEACHTDCTRCAGNGWIVDLAALAQPVEAGEGGPPFACAYCGAPSWVDPSDQSPPAGYCHPEDHGAPEEGKNDER